MGASSARRSVQAVNAALTHPTTKRVAAQALAATQAQFSRTRTGETPQQKAARRGARRRYQAAQAARRWAGIAGGSGAAAVVAAAPLGAEPAAAGLGVVAVVSAVRAVQSRGRSRRPTRAEVELGLIPEVGASRERQQALMRKPTFIPPSSQAARAMSRVEEQVAALRGLVDQLPMGLRADQGAVALQVAASAQDRSRAMAERVVACEQARCAVGDAGAKAELDAVISGLLTGLAAEGAALDELTAAAAAAMAAGTGASAGQLAGVRLQEAVAGLRAVQDGLQQLGQHQPH